jgi:hypothetical protein
MSAFEAIALVGICGIATYVVFLLTDPAPTDFVGRIMFVSGFAGVCLVILAIALAMIGILL